MARWSRCLDLTSAGSCQLELFDGLILRESYNVFLEPLGQVRGHPLNWRSHALLFGGVFGFPLVSLALVGANLHFVYEERFNQNLLFDLVARPAPFQAHIPGLAA